LPLPVKLRTAKPSWKYILMLVLCQS
jgi:hypothetical protein